MRCDPSNALSRRSSVHSSLLFCCICSFFDLKTPFLTFIFQQFTAMADRYQFNEISHVDFGGNARNQDVSTLAKQFHKSCSIAPEEQQLSPSSKKEAATSKPSTSRNETSKEKCHEERSSKKEASASSLKRKQGVNDDGSWKMKEDSNAQVKAMDGFMFYLQLEWENVKKDNPGIPYKDIGRLLARRWYKMSAEDQKALHEAAEADKI